ncbi:MULTISPECIES: glutamate ABC transporter substrate-binding protein [Rhodococcus]|uniref:glutamate ABC transporter substrate-binding protein n=1 Tax=Rhodococcus TaxID=1827 RepID=UPI0002F72F2A|nr:MULTISPECIES: glutamate ABC transporter substrate-binding protein [Rhodococcus]KXF57267.1 ABC transporter substrate-binding protein [Rhodococcus sp. SC4]RZK70919.1 MAG: glutamate ABC transporter substrate-binding protein [Rhodococcus sp. (in: high G+C Gram-positive bacteria)]AHK31451.1 ABC transporter glutamine-binding protein glnH [Rhodococcus opacus PD630]KXX59793.1 ABC transporter substrate-binding protein [Rhodococcus sp. LB1]PBC45364.1 ABC transporter substrate-binding protein [Rhodoco
MVRPHSDRRPRSARLLGSLAFGAVLLAGCGAPDAPTPRFSGDFTEFPLSAGAQLIAPSEAPPPATEPSACVAQASLRPGAPSLGGTIDDIRARGTVVVAVDQNTNLFSFRDPTTGTLTGFGVDLAREVARDLLGDPTKVEFRPLGTDDGAEMLAHRDADMVVRPVALPCEVSQDLAFSTVYLEASRRLVVRDGSGISGPADLARRRVCTHNDPASVSALSRIAPKATILAVPDWDDCLMAIQQRQVDAVAGAAVLAGLVAQDPNLEIVGPETDSAQYTIGLAPGNDDLVRFVNGTLERLRTDGTWTALYDRWLSSLGPAPGPPAPEYRD